LIPLVGQTGQIVLEVRHAVVGCAIRALLDTVLFGNLPRLIFTLPESVAEIFSRMALLFGKRAGLGIAQRFRKIGKASLDVSAIDLAL
jgi:hypothetical protein